MANLTLSMAIFWIALCGPIHAADILLNEYNAVGSTAGFLGGANSDSRLGTREGNGGNWFELVVITDHLDIRGWQIAISNRTGEPIFPGPGEENYVLLISQESVWSDLRSGTIITISEEIPQNVDDYEPVIGEWWLNVKASNFSAGRYISASDFSVSNNKTQITIKNHLGQAVFGPAGEGISPPAGVGRSEVFKLETDPSSAVTPGSLGYTAGSSSTFGMANAWTDLSGPTQQDLSALQAVVPYAPLSTVVINEISTHNAPPQQDWIELYNTTGSPIDIGGWFLSDGPRNLVQHEIAAGTVIAPNGYLVFMEVALPFSLNGALGEAVYFSEGTPSGDMTGYRDYVKFGPLEQFVSFGRSPNGTGPFYRMEQQTAGAANALPLVGPIVINEVMYHAGGLPPTGLTGGDLDFVELHNLEPFEAPLYADHGAGIVAGMEIDGGVDFTFSTSASIIPESYLLVVSFDPVIESEKLQAFRTHYGVPDSITILGPYAGKLNNYSDSVELRRPDVPEFGISPMVVHDAITYVDIAPWPTSADGEGPSLERVDPSVAGRDPADWSASLLLKGTPGKINSVTLALPEPKVLPGLLVALFALLCLERRRQAARS